MKDGRKILLATTALALSLALSLALAPVALAHGFAPHREAAGGHPDPEGLLGVLLLPPEFVLGGVAFFGLLYALRRHGG